MNTAIREEASFISTQASEPSTARSNAELHHTPSFTSKLLRRLQSQSRSTQLLVFLALFLFVAWLDFFLVRDVSLFALYLLPTLYSAWMIGIHWGYLSCVASAIVGGIFDAGPATFSHLDLIPYWNLTGRFIVLVVLVAVVNALKGSLEEEHIAERRAVQREFDIAYEVQSRLLPSKEPNYPPLEFGSFYKPAREVGGDYYDFIPLSPERLGMAIGDVSGKGLSSALLMASLQGLMRTNLALRQGELATSMGELNQSFHKLTATNRFATLFFATIDTSSLLLNYVNAGHNPPLLFRSLQKPLELAAGGPIVGMFPVMQYRAGQISLHDGDVLVAFTDGVVEARNAQEEEFGEERVIEFVQSALSLSATEICAGIQNVLQAFVADSPQWDDIALVVVKVRPSVGDTASS